MILKFAPNPQTLQCEFRKSTSVEVLSLLSSFAFLLTKIKAMDTTVPQSTHLLKEYHVDTNVSSDAITLQMKTVPSEINILMIRFLQKGEIHSLMRTCKFHLYSYKQHKHQMVIEKFNYLINEDNNANILSQLLQTPLIDSVTSKYQCCHHHLSHIQISK